MDAPSLAPKSRNYLAGDMATGTWRATGTELVHPISPSDGLVSDWDALEAVWDHALHSLLRSNPSSQPLMVVEPDWAPAEHRARIAELAFERFNVPALFLARSAVLSAFAAGKPTALVIDAGSSQTRCVPVLDGYSMRRGVRRTALAGTYLSEYALDYLTSTRDIAITPRWCIKSKQTTEPNTPARCELRADRAKESTSDAWWHMGQLRVVDEFKEAVCQIYESQWRDSDPQADAIVSARPSKTFEFPDGYSTVFGTERLTIPEVLFSPRKTTGQHSPPAMDASVPVKGVHELAMEAVNSCDIDLRPHLLSNVVVAGGCSLLPGFADRIQTELTSMAPNYRVKIHAPGNTSDRRFSSWIGGSILASLGTFHQMWVSKKEWDDGGLSVIERKCQ